MASGVTVEDVGNSAGAPITDPFKVKQTEDWIRDAETVIRLRLGPLEKLDHEALRLVVKESVARRVMNPKGKSSERIDDYSFQIPNEAAKAGLWIWPEEWDMLTPEDTDRGAFSILPGMRNPRV